MPWQRRAESNASPGEAAFTPDQAAADQEPSSAGPVSADLLAWAQAVDVSRLSDRTLKQAERFLRDYPRLNYLARREHGLRLRTLVERQVSPPPPATIAVPDIAATVVSAWRKQMGIG